MKKTTLIASAAALLAAATMVSSSAEAGFKIGIGIGIPIGGYHNTYNPPHWRQRTYVERKANRTRIVKKKPSEPSKPDVADMTAQNENSSISVAALPATDIAPVADTPITGSAAVSTDTATPANPPQTRQEASVSPAAADTPVVEQKLNTSLADGLKTGKKLDCKKFFPSVGMTVSVTCE
jgi:hypothetical protein